MEGRSWNPEETKLCSKISAIPVNNLMVTLEKKALKKSSTQEVFESVLKEIQMALEKPSFKEKKTEKNKKKVG